jgi:hypothetical protein
MNKFIPHGSGGELKPDPEAFKGPTLQESLDNLPPHIRAQVEAADIGESPENRARQYTEEGRERTSGHLHLQYQENPSQRNLDALGAEADQVVAEIDALIRSGKSPDSSDVQALIKRHKLLAQQAELEESQGLKLVAEGRQSIDQTIAALEAQAKVQDNAHRERAVEEVQARHGASALKIRPGRQY